MSSTERQILSLSAACLSSSPSSLLLLSRGAASSLSFSSLLPPSSITLSSSLASLPTGVDVIVSDQFLNDEKIIDDADALDSFAKSILRSLREGGVLLLRENLAQNEASARSQLPALTAFFDVFRVNEDGDQRNLLGFEFYAADQIDASIHEKQNWLDILWVLRKKHFEKPAESAAAVTFRDFLDKTQYTNTGIGAYEWMFGKDFISPGGYDENSRVLSYFPSLEQGRKMLDIGSGIGGGVRQAASVYGIQVTGVDLSSNMLSDAIVRVHRERDSRVKYTICDALTFAFPSASFDYVFSRDCIQHISDKALLFRNIFNSLRPGGTVVISLYGRGACEWTEKFKQYVEKRAYFLLNCTELSKLATDAGFTEVFTENMTGRFKEILVSEKLRLEKEKADFLKHYTEQEFASLTDGWEDKLHYIDADNHNWLLFRARRPDNSTTA